MPNGPRSSLIVPVEPWSSALRSPWLGAITTWRPAAIASRNYADSLKLVSARLGHIQLQNLTKAHLDDLVTALLDHGRRVSNVQRQGLSPAASTWP